MELRQLEYYVAVVQHGSILQAASALNYPVGYYVDGCLFLHKIGIAVQCF